MSKENKLIPELRFPEFENKEWNISPIDDYCDVFRGSTFSKSDINEDGSEPCIHYGELFTKYNEVISKVYSRTDKQDGFKSEAGDVLMPSSDVTPDGLARASAITLDNVILGGDMNILRPYKGINSIFLSYLLNHSKREIIKLVSGTTVKHIYPSQIITCELPVIENEVEQQKIASCLSSLDELIAAHNDKLDALKDHKKGLLQNLFPQDGETVPRVRFPEFEGDGEWVEKKLGDVFDTFSGGTPKSTEKKYYGGSIPFIRSAEIAKNSTELFLTEEGLKNSSAKLVKKGDLLIALYGANSGDVAISQIDGAINQAILCLSSDYSNDFVSHYFFLKKDWILRTYLQGGQGNLSGQIVKSIEFSFPKKKEQQKIASCLSAVDELITARQEKIEELQQHKKGLMQGLFPKMV